MLIHGRIADPDEDVVKFCFLHDCSLEVTNIVESLEPVQYAVRVVWIGGVSRVVEESVVDEEESWVRRVQVLLWNSGRIVTDVEVRSVVAMAVEFVAKIAQKIWAEDYVLLMEARLILHARSVFVGLIEPNRDDWILKHF